jgi:hypothetical protein
MPGAGLAHGPPAKKMQAAGTTGSAENVRHPPRDGFNAYTWSPRCTGLSGHRVRQRVNALRRASASGCQDRTTSRPSARIRLPRAKRPSHPRPTCRDDRAQRPSARDGIAASNHNFCKNETVIFFAAGLDSTNRVERICENSPCAHPDFAGDKAVRHVDRPHRSIRRTQTHRKLRPLLNHSDRLRDIVVSCSETLLSQAQRTVARQMDHDPSFDPSRGCSPTHLAHETRLGGQAAPSRRGRSWGASFRPGTPRRSG